MYYEIVLSLVIIPPCIAILLSLIRNQFIKTSEMNNDRSFVVKLPKIVAIIGVICVVQSMVVMLVFTYTSTEQPHLIFYIFFGFFMWFGAYLIWRTFTFKVAVRYETISVYKGLRKPYSFAFKDIESAKRQVKNNKVKSERVVIKTVDGKKLIVEKAETSYNVFVKRLKLKVSRERLIDF